jgi:ketosteroid isomerase-like protein
MVHEFHELAKPPGGVPMNRDQLDRIVDQHFGHEAADDVEGVLATMTDDATHHVVGSPWGELSGKDSIRPFYEELFAALGGTGVEPVARWYGDDFVVDESLWTGRVEDGRVFGLPGRSGDVTFRLLHVFELHDGLIRTERVWADVVTIARHLQ